MKKRIKPRRGHDSCQTGQGSDRSFKPSGPEHLYFPEIDSWLADKHEPGSMEEIGLSMEVLRLRRKISLQKESFGDVAVADHSVFVLLVLDA